MIKTMKSILLLILFLPTYLYSQENLSIAGPYKLGDDINIENVDDFETNYNRNTSLFDFIGVWQYSQGSEALNISKNLTNDSIKIQYNSVFDGYEDRFFENCKFINGKIIGDYYGGKENAILVINEGNLLLTIDPFHEFQPIKKQLFKNQPEAIFKYCSQNENTYIKNGNQKVDSLPPGDRVLVSVEIESKDYFSLLYYNNRFNKTPHNKKINRYILPKQLSDIKPLFISEDVNLEFFKNYNESELFVKKLYAPEKLKENIRIVSVPEQNRAGQKKLFIDKEVYSKLGLENIKMYYDNLFITGTVDLSKEYRSITVDFQSDYEYYTYLINYDKNGKYIDHILISRNDYVESMTPIKSIFAPGEIYVNSLLQNWVEDGVDIGSSYYQTFETVRYVINQKGQFIASNYATSFMHEPELSFRVVTQQIESKTYGNALLSLYQNYIDTNYAGGYVISMHTKIETEKGMEFIIPMDFSSVAGFYYPPFGDFIGPFGELQKLFYTNHTDALERLRISFTLKDMNNDGIDDLNIKIVDANYVVEPEEEILFIQKGSEWVLHKN